MIDYLNTMKSILKMSLLYVIEGYTLNFFGHFVLLGKYRVGQGPQWLRSSLKEIETKTLETICIEFTISKKKWYVLFAERPSKQSKEAFFQECKNAYRI